MKTRIVFGFKHHKTEKNPSFQVALFEVVKEYYDDNGDLYYAEVIFRIKGKAYRELEKKPGRHKRSKANANGIS